MAATRAQTDSTSSISPSNKDVKADKELTMSQTPVRRTTTRTRKLPSRLLPSPSPPPSRPSTHYNATRHVKSGKDASPSPTPASAPLTPQPQPRSRRSIKLESPVTPIDHTSSEIESAEKDGDTASDDTGPGKRKRRPSSMYRPPSTLTSTESPASVQTTTSKSKKKGRSSSPEGSLVKAHPASLSATQGKNKARWSRAKGEADNTSEKKASDDFSGYGSDGGLDGAMERGNDSEVDQASSFVTRVPKKPRLTVLDDVSDLSPPPLLPRDGSARVKLPTEFTQPTFIKGGLVSVSPESGVKRMKSASKSVGRSLTDSLSQSRPNFDVSANDAHHTKNSKRDGQRLWRHTDGLSSSPVSPAVSRFDSCAYVRPAPGPFSRDDLHSRLRQNAMISMDDAEDEDEEDEEDDFHQAMLDANFDLFDSQRSEQNAVAAWQTSQRRSSEEIEIDDTPATTPRSPLSSCDLPTPGSPGCKSDGQLGATKCKAKTSFLAGGDSVFVHALPTTQVGADKPHQHAGSLTLSLPYSPEVAASSPQLKAMDVDVEAISPVKPLKGTSASHDKLTTPIIQRRTHSGSNAAQGLGMLKFGPELNDRLSSSTAHFMQLSPMIEMGSPLLSPGLSLTLNGKGAEIASPFVIGVSALPDLEQPAPLSLPPAQKEKANTEEIGPANAKESAVRIPAETTTDVKTETLPLKRPQLPPPRQIRFTTFTTATDMSAPRLQSQPQPHEPLQSLPKISAASEQETQLPAVPAKAAPSAVRSDDCTPDLVYSGSSSPDSVSESASPASRSETDSSADSEVENILFGPPEKLDMQELDQVWGGAKASLSNASLIRRAQMPRVHRVGLAPH